MRYDNLSIRQQRRLLALIALVTDSVPFSDAGSRAMAARVGDAPIASSAFQALAEARSER